MIELRWLVKPRFPGGKAKEAYLQYRIFTPPPATIGPVYKDCGWSEWKSVPKVEAPSDIAVAGEDKIA